MRVAGLIVACALLLGLPGAAAAHHILGLPHYKYSKDYPQIPFVEIMARTRHHELTFTYFPGTPEPGQRVRFKLYVKDMRDGKPFRKPLAAQVVQRRFIRDNLPLGERLTLRTGVGPEANDYKFFLTFPNAEAYEVQVTFPEGGAVEVIPFAVTIGQTDDRPLLLGAAGTLALAVVIVALINRRRRREKDPEETTS